jgi:outer membrane protein OmpA-like peptidoglycan-associated protein
MERFKNLTYRLGKNLLLLVISFLLKLPATTDASDIWQLSYIYRYGLVKDAGENAFVVCDNCTERKRLPLSFREKILSSLAVRASEDILERPALIKETEKVESTTHELSCLFTAIHFGFDNHEIPPEERDKLLHMSKMLSGNERVEVKVEGYTCDIGTEEYNQLLSTKRAEVVAAFLKENGINVTEIVGKGECFVVSAKDKALSRRAEVILQINPVRK